MKKLFYGLLAGVLLFSSCSDKDDETPSVGTFKKAKITITVSDDFRKADGDFFNTSVVASNITGNISQWKVNDETLKNQNVELDTDDFEGGATYVIQADEPFYGLAITLGGSTNGSTFHISYKIEIDGKVENSEENVAIKAEDEIYTKGFSYTADN
ncbi:hypothetical protein GCM10023231_19830 [Olivibacter ginsenosidimutans]|uniref:DUF4382 domain-containing protein n=1 Tax=Olivibacter ginsenosidimutans TaxID=1176537 RepID=A0ABP9BBM4_9SPHI